MLNKMLDSVRFALYVLLAVIGLMLYQAWQKDHPQAEVPAMSAASTEHAPAIPNSQISQAASAASVAPGAIPTLPPSATGKIVTIKTDLLDVKLDTKGGDIIGVNLLAYPESLGSSSSYVLLNDDAKTRYIAESGLLSNAGPDTAQGQAVYTVSQDHYELGANQPDLIVRLDWTNSQGINVAKFFTFKRNSYEVGVSYEITNHTAQPWQGSLYTQLMRTDSPPVNHGSGLMNLATYFGAAISSPQKSYYKITFKQMREKNIDQAIQGGWAAMIQHYFISAWIPAQNATSTFYSKVTADGLFALGMIGQPLTIAPGATGTVAAKLYTGPATADRLEQTAPNLKLTIDYGWFWFISIIIFWMMQKIYDVVGIGVGQLYW